MIKANSSYFQGLLAVALLSASVLLVGLHSAPVPSIDGSIRAVEARNIVRTGQWLPILFRASPAETAVLDHPPLYVWAQAVSMHIFGINDFAANVPARLAAFASMLFLFMVMVEGGWGLFAGFVAVAICLATRDFILNSVRGYLEPYFILFTLLSIWGVLKARVGPLIYAFMAGVSSFLVLFTKGPPGIWTFLFCLFLIGISFNHRRLKITSRFVLGFLLSVGAFAALTTHFGQWQAWHDHYWQQQILYTVVGKRNAVELPGPFYFIHRLVTTYWPWLPLMIFAYVSLWRRPGQWLLKSLSIYPWGIIGGFSLIGWKYWYYTVPALPFFALVIAATFREKIDRFFEMKSINSSWILAMCFSLTVSWSLVYSIFPISLNKNRIPEVAAFKNAVLQSPVGGAIRVFRSSKDFNILQTTGEWAFDRAVESTTEEAFKMLPPAPVLMITDSDRWKECLDDYCRRGILVQEAFGSALVILNPFTTSR